ncbi:MAG: hypothetical protein Q9164_001012, partial [Protoblastenia rupestris]
MPKRDQEAASTSDSDIENLAPPAKRSKIAAVAKSHKASPIKTYTPSELTSLSHSKLLAHTILLTQRLAEAVAAAKSNPHTAASSPSREKVLDSEALAKKIAKLRSTMIKQIKKSMTWKPSCKT